MSGSQDSGTCVFDYKPDGDDDGFIDDFVQERSSEVHLMCRLFTSFSKRSILTRSVWRPKFCQGSGVLKKSAVEYLSITFIDTFQLHLINTPATPQLTLDWHSIDISVSHGLRVYHLVFYCYTLVQGHLADY